MTLELINLAVDKEASPAQQAELAEILGRSEEARIAFESIQEVVQQLEAAAPVDVPPEIKTEVIDALRRSQEARSAQPAWPGAEVKPFPRRWAMAAVWAAAAVIGAVAFLPQLRTFDSSPIASQASGAMTRPAAAEWAEVARGTSTNFGITVKRSGERINVSASSHSTSPLMVRWDGSKLDLDPKDRQTAPQSPGESASAVLRCSTTGCPELHFKGPSSVPTELFAMTADGETIRLTIPAR